MNHKKLSTRVFSFAITVAMIFTMLPSTVFATEGDAVPAESGVIENSKEQESLEGSTTTAGGNDSDTIVASVSLDNGKSYQSFLEADGDEWDKGQAFALQYAADHATPLVTPIMRLEQHWYLADTAVVRGTNNIILDLNGYNIDRGLTNCVPSGEALYLTIGAKLTLRDTSPGEPGKITGGASTNGAGGVVINRDSTLYLIGGNICGNRSGKSGAGIQLAEPGATLQMTGGIVEKNIAEGNGGGIAIMAGNAQLSGGVVRENTATNGGGIYLGDKGTLLALADQIEITENHATDGGGIYIASGMAEMNGGTISKNTASLGGGGAFLNGEKASVGNCTITQNEAKNGAGIYVGNASLLKEVIISGASINGNKASAVGGGLYLSAPQDGQLVCLQSGQITKNSAAEHGAGVGSADVYTFYLGSPSADSPGQLILAENEKDNLAFDRLSNFTTVDYLHENSRVVISLPEAATAAKVLTSQPVLDASPLNKLSVQPNTYTLSLDSKGFLLATPTGFPPSVLPTKYNGQPLIEGTCTFPSVKGSRDLETTFFYSDGYFISGTDSSGIPSDYDPHLATMSLNMAMSASSSNIGGTDEYSDKDKPIKTLLSAIGCNSVETNGAYALKPTQDSIAVAVAQKTLPDGTILLPIAIRGSGYEREWASNFTIGGSGEATGFANATDQVMTFVTNYIAKHQLETTKLKMWVVGYSRGGAVANLTAKRLTDAYNSAEQRVFAYCFAVPLGGEPAGKPYNNIHNMVNPGDLVGYVAPSGLGFVRYGITHNMPENTPGTEAYAVQKQQMLRQLNTIDSEIKFTDRFQTGTFDFSTMGTSKDKINHWGTIEEWLSQLMLDIHTWTIHDRADYAVTPAKNGVTLEDAIRRLVDLAFEIDADQQQKLLDCIQEIPNRTDLAAIGVYILDGNWEEVDPKEQDKAFAQLKEVFFGNTQKELDDFAQDPAKYPLPDYPAKYLTPSQVATVRDVGDTVMYIAFDILSGEATNDLRHVGTALSSIDSVILAHYPEVSLAWLRTQDVFYDSKATDPIPPAENDTEKRADAKEPVTGNSNINATIDNQGNTTVNVTEKNISEAVKAAQDAAKKKGVNAGKVTVVISVTSPANSNPNTVFVNLPKNVQQNVINNKIGNVVIAIDKPAISIDMTLATITEMNKQANAEIQLSATRTDATRLSTEAKNAIGSRPAFCLKATFAGGSKNITNFGTGTVTIAIGYALQKGEVASGIYAIYVDGNGKANYLTTSSYDADAKVLWFSTNHFSVYGIGYKAPIAFTDVAGHWAEESIKFVVAESLFNGTSTTSFSPDMHMDRAMLVTVLGRMAKIDPSKYADTQFADVAATAYYASFVAWAAELGVVKGTGTDSFSPTRAITRQELAVMLVNYAKVAGLTLPKAENTQKFADNDSIAPWAQEAMGMLQQAGILTGRLSNLAEPNATASRAEVATLLQRFMELTSK